MATSASTSKPTDTSQPVDTSKVENPAAVGVLEEDDEFEEFAVAGLQTSLLHAQRILILTIRLGRL
jgi:hypothetical protein